MTTEATTATAEEQAAALAATAAVVAAPLDLGNAPPAAVIPAEAKTETPPIDDKGKKDDEVQAVVYNPTGDVGLDMALGFVGKHGFGPETPEMAAAVKGDFSLLSAALAGKGAVGYEQYIKLGEKAFAENGAKQTAKNEASRKAVESTVGGAEAWKEIQAWASANADEGERKEYGAMLAAGGVQAKAAAALLRDLYQGSKAGAPTDGAGPKAVTTNGAAGANTALSARDYVAALDIARRDHRGPVAFEESPAYKQLSARRSASRG